VNTQEAADQPRARRPRAKKAAPIDHRVPPRFVRHKPTGRVTTWSTLFRRNVNDFEPFYRPNTDDEFQHKVARRRHEAKLALKSGNDPYLGANTRNSAFAEDDFDAEDAL